MSASDYLNAAIAALQTFAAKTQSAIVNMTVEDAFCYSKLVLAGVGFLSLFTFLLPYIWAFLTNWEQDLKKKYNAQWAIVTGKLCLALVGSELGRAALHNEQRQRGSTVVGAPR